MLRFHKTIWVAWFLIFNRKNDRKWNERIFWELTVCRRGGRGSLSSCPLHPTVLLPNCYWTLMGNPVKEEKIKWVSKDVFSQNNFCSKTRCFLFSSQLLLKHTWANPRSRGGDKFPKFEQKIYNSYFLIQMLSLF